MLKNSIEIELNFQKYLERLILPIYGL